MGHRFEKSAKNYYLCILEEKTESKGNPASAVDYQLKV
jgi:hypothetical protein